MGFTETSLQEHVTSEHAETSTEVVSTPHTERSPGAERAAALHSVTREVRSDVRANSSELHLSLFAVKNVT